MTFAGSLENVNSAISSVTCRGEPNYHGDDTITITVTDLGSTGLGGRLTTREDVPITVAPVSDLPMISDVPDQLIQKDEPLAPIPFSIKRHGIDDRYAGFLNHFTKPVADARHTYSA